MIPRFTSKPRSAPAPPSISIRACHYLRDVLRREAGAGVLLFNGREGEWQGSIERASRTAARIAVERQTRPQQASPDLWLVFAPIKGDRIDALAEKATELGCRCLWPMFTQHTAVPRVNAGRLRARAIEAAEQTERLDVPEIRSPAKLGELLANWSATRRLLVCAEFGEAQPIAEALGQLPTDGAYAVMTGPEGGFARLSLTLSANCLLLPPSDWGRACCAPIPPRLRRFPAGRRFLATAGSVRRHADPVAR
jgi:16S rRNA (uracil1498-N3)-methyltransferase